MILAMGFLLGWEGNAAFVVLVKLKRWADSLM
jgi:hypothetical protein